MRFLTDSKNPIVASRRRIVFISFIGIAGSLALAFVLSFVGAVCIAMPMAAVFSMLMMAKAPPIMMTCLAGAGALAICAGQYYAGRMYMSLVSRLAMDHRKEAVTPIFLSSLAVWGLLGLSIAFSGGLNFGTFAVVAGIALNVFGQRQKMIELRRGPQVAGEPVIKIESSSSNFYEQLFELKTAESIEHLEQISKQCLTLIKPAAVTSSDCTSVLIDELMKRKLRAEADELSALQLKLIDKDK